MATTFEELQILTPDRREDGDKNDDRSDGAQHHNQPSTDAVDRRAREDCYSCCNVTSYLVPLFGVEKCDDVVKHYDFTVAGAQTLVFLGCTHIF